MANPFEDDGIEYQVLVNNEGQHSLWPTFRRAPDGWSAVESARNRGSTRGVAILPIYAVNFLPWSVVSRPIAGETPTIDLVLGYHRANNSPILKLFLSKADELIDRVSPQHP